MNTNSICLETKSDTDGVEAAVAEMTTAFNTKMAALSADVKTATDRADALELKMNRPGSVTNDNGTTVETKAFETFIRKGREGMTGEIKSLRVSDDTAGGYLATSSFQAELDRNVVLYSPIRSVARVLPTGSGSVLWPNRTSGFTASWTGENGARTETTATFGQKRYPVFELAAYVDVSNSILEDSNFDIAALLGYEFSEEFGRAESAAFVNGASTITPSGFMQDSGLAYTPTGAAATLTADSLIDIYQAVKTPYRANAVWGMNSNTLGAVRKLKDSQNRYLLSLAGLDNSPATTILGRPVVEMPDLPDVGAGAFPIVFGDFSQGYRIFDRISLSILRDPFSMATQGMTRFHGRRRVGAGVGKAEALRKLKVSVS